MTKKKHAFPGILNDCVVLSPCNLPTLWIFDEYAVLSPWLIKPSSLTAAAEVGNNAAASTDAALTGTW